MALSNATLVRVYSSGALGEGSSRVATGTVQSARTVGTPDTITTTVTVTAPAAMTATELTAYQTFVNGLDEEAVIAAALVVLDPEPA